MKKLQAVSHTQVRVDGGFWGERLRVNREATLPIAYEQCQATGRIDAFRLDWRPGAAPPPHIYWDSDVAKWIEAVSYNVAARPDQDLAGKLDEVVALVASAQQDDGYLNVYFTAVEPEKRWTNLRDCHELYCAGHLIEAAIAHHEATGKRTLLDALCRYADCIADAFGPEPGQKRGYPGHPEIELALVKLYRATSKKRYLDLAKFFIDERGRTPHYFDIEARERGEDPAAFGQGYDSCQAHIPVRQQQTAEGHAVRACYLYAGMADVAAETGDRELFQVCRNIWRNIVRKRMYIHGGIGSTRFGERFTVDYDLPNEDAYAETCAAIALVFFAHRMLQTEPLREYADVMERALYNGVISGASLDGTRFFYDNYLASQPGIHRFTIQKPPVRQQWFGCACCPTNLIRVLASIGQYVYSLSGQTLWVHLFVAGQADVELDGCSVRLVQETDYPWDGDIRITLFPEQPRAFTVALRVPGWCREATLSVNGEPQKLVANQRSGYVTVRRRWREGDEIHLTLPMPIEQIEAHPSVRHNCGRVALQRGPVVYCLEEADNDANLNDIVVPREGTWTVQEAKSGILKGFPVILGAGFRRRAGEWRDTLYKADPSALRPCRIRAVPYFTWANRGEGEMIVWIRRADFVGKAEP